MTSLVFRRWILPSVPKRDLHAGALDLLQQKLHRRTRGDMRFLRVEQAGAEAACQIGFQLGDRVAVDALVTFGQPREVIHLALVACTRNDQRALDDGARIRLSPQPDRLEPEVAHDRRIHFLFAERPQHGAGIGAGGIRKGLGRPLDEPYAMALASQRQGLPQAGDAGAGDGDAACLHGIRAVNLRAPRLRGGGRRRPPVARPCARR